MKILLSLCFGECQPHRCITNKRPMEKLHTHTPVTPVVGALRVLDEVYFVKCNECWLLEVASITKCSMGAKTKSEKTWLRHEHTGTNLKQCFIKNSTETRVLCLYVIPELSASTCYCLGESISISQFASLVIQIHWGKSQLLMPRLLSAPTHFDHLSILPSCLPSISLYRVSDLAHPLFTFSKVWLNVLT